MTGKSMDNINRALETIKAECERLRMNNERLRTELAELKASTDSPPTSETMHALKSACTEIANYFTLVNTEMPTDQPEDN